jgi:hypothetical protein
MPTVNTVQHLSCSGTQVLAHCQYCAAYCLCRYKGTCPLSALCSILLDQVKRYLPTVSNVQHLACSGTQVLAHCYHCAALCLLRYTGTFPLSALCSILLVQVQRYLPTFRKVQHLACSGTQVLAHCYHCAAPCLLRYTGTCLLSVLCSTFLACSGTQGFAYCHQCAAPCLLKYRGACLMSALCSTLLA